MNPWFIEEMYLAEVFSIGITLVNVHLNWLNWFDFFVLKRGPLIVLIVFMIFLSLFLDITRNYVNSFFLCTGSEILSLQHGFL